MMKEKGQTNIEIYEKIFFDSLTCQYPRWKPVNGLTLPETVPGSIATYAHCVTLKKAEKTTNFCIFV